MIAQPTVRLLKRRRETLTCLVVVSALCLASQLTRTINCEQQVASSKQEASLELANGGAAALSADQSTAANSISSQQQINGPVAQVNAPGLGASSQQRPQSQPLVPPKLPKINIFLSKSECKKLLGIENKRIYYVNDGNINTYPFNFVIPMGYNQSDMIFTWQNLSPTNVNYSISLVIGNIQVVDPPLINITRSGLVPRHEQVFKITLPCSGKVTDEVDVEVLINITGSVPLGQPADGDFSYAAAADDSAASEQFGDAQLAAAVQQANASADGMQSDEPQQQFRLVSHTLAIKRRKICTMHPVPIQPKVWPANQPARPLSTPAPPQPQPQPPAPPAPEPPIRWLHSSAPSTEPDAPAHHPSLGPTPEQLDQDQPAARPPNGTARPSRPSAPPRRPEQPLQPAAGGLSAYPNWPTRLVTPPLVPSSIPPENPLLGELLRPHQNFTTSTTSANTSGSVNSMANPLVVTLAVMLLMVAVAVAALLLLGSSAPAASSAWSDTKRQPFDKFNALTSCLLRRAPASCSRAQTKSSTIKAAGIIGPLRVPRAATSMRSAHNTKSNASSLSGLSAIVSGGTSPAKAAYCFKWNNNGNAATNYSANGYYTTSYHHHHQQQQQSAYNQLHHHYQLPPTADLLGTGYQCQPAQQQQQQANNYPIYHIATGNTNQTTRLIWNNGNGTSPDGFTIDGGSYMPLSNAPRSDSGSLYQTISG